MTGKKLKVSLTFCLFVFAVSLVQAQSINRQALVQRHTIINTKVDSLESLSVGNGKFAYTVDITGLQTFPERYSKGVTLGTQSEWGWNRLKDTVGYKFEETLKEYTLNGKKSSYSVQFSGADSRQRSASDWFRKSVHRIQLGNLGLDIYKRDGALAKSTDIKNIRQSLNMWTGEITSHFTVEDVPVDVITVGHQDQDLVAFQIRSPLIKTGQLKVRLRYPYPTMEFLDEGVNYKDPQKHKSSIVAQDASGATIQHELEGITYSSVFKWNSATAAVTSTPHSYQVTPDKKTDVFEFSCLFTPQQTSATALPTFSQTRANSQTQLKKFWMSGAAIDLAGSTDPRAKELERRVITSEYLTKIQCAGSFPPQETGLTYNSWFGKPHLEMHWWHGIHFALWNRPELLEKSLDWYFKVEDGAKEIARRQGFKGARWQKMTDHEGLESPSSVGAFIIWQQPHPIYMAELLYRNSNNKEVLDKYKDIVFQTAEFMSSFAVYDSAKQRYNLGKGLIPAQEVFKAVDTYNPTYELAYWDWALRIAQKWRERMGMGRNNEWDTVINKLAALPKQNGVYLSTENTPDSFTNEEWLRDHPSVLGALGMVPAGAKLDKATMQRTFDTVWKVWKWDDTWGWDFPMTAMTAARLGKPEKAIDALFMNIKTNTYLKNGHNYQDGRLRIYLPGNGGVLATVAMLAGGWDGSSGPNPGFPKNGKWKVKSEGFKKMP